MKMEKKNTSKNKIQLDFKSIWQALLKHKYLFVKTVSTTFIIACIITLSLPNYYTAGVTMAPEKAGKSGSGGLSSLASSFGVSLGSMSSGEDALSPSLYPDMINSVDFKTSLFPILIHELDSNESYSYYVYLKEYQRSSWWNAAKSAVIKSIKSLFSSKSDVQQEETVNPFMLTKEQDAIIKVMNKKIRCEVDKKTNVISINVTDQDPLVAAIMADSVKQRLQDKITEYRTSKARVDLEYNKMLFEEMKAKYDEARQQYAAYADANQDVILQRDRNKLIELENEMQLRYQAFSTVGAQLQAAEAKVQEETPAFTTLQSATVPLIKAGPSRTRIVIIFCFLSCLITFFYVLYHEGYFFKLMFGIDAEDE